MKAYHWLTNILFIVVSITVAMPVFSQEKECSGPYNGKKLTQEQLNIVIEAHYLYQLERAKNIKALKASIAASNKKWREKLTKQKQKLPISKEPKKANLCGALLEKTSLQGAYLWGANLQGADLDLANLENANLYNVKLQGASLRSAELKSAELGEANLESAYLYWANLESASIRSTNLKSANLTRANLKSANLTNANLESAKVMWANLDGVTLVDANLSGTNLNGTSLRKASLINTEILGARLLGADISEAIYEPISAPDSRSLSNLKGIQTVKLSNANITGLVALRNALKEAGLRELERQATYKIELWRTSRAPFLERWLKTLFIEYTTNYGLNPSRAIKIIFVLIFVFSILYIAPIVRTGKNDTGIYKVWPTDGKEDEIIIEKNYQKIVGLALYFSLLSAFHLGWRDLNVGNWISRLQPRNYDLQAMGWVRTVAGLQSLISVYLLAIWALTYFGRPFE